MPTIIEQINRDENKKEISLKEIQDALKDGGLLNNETNIKSLVDELKQQDKILAKSCNASLEKAFNALQKRSPELLSPQEAKIVLLYYRLVQGRVDIIIKDVLPEDIKKEFIETQGSHIDFEKINTYVANEEIREVKEQAKQIEYKNKVKSIYAYLVQNKSSFEEGILDVSKQDKKLLPSVMQYFIGEQYVSHNTPVDHVVSKWSMDAPLFSYCSKHAGLDKTKVFSELSRLTIINNLKPFGKIIDGQLVLDSSVVEAQQRTMQNGWNTLVLPDAYRNDPQSWNKLRVFSETKGMMNAFKSPVFQELASISQYYELRRELHFPDVASKEQKQNIDGFLKKYMSLNSEVQKFQSEIEKGNINVKAVSKDMNKPFTGELAKSDAFANDQKLINKQIVGGVYQKEVGTFKDKLTSFVEKQTPRIIKDYVTTLIDVYAKKTSSYTNPEYGTTSFYDKGTIQRVQALGVVHLPGAFGKDVNLDLRNFNGSSSSIDDIIRDSRWEKISDDPRELLKLIADVISIIIAGALAVLETGFTGGAGVVAAGGIFYGSEKLIKSGLYGVIGFATAKEGEGRREAAGKLAGQGFGLLDKNGDIKGIKSIAIDETFSMVSSVVLMGPVGKVGQLLEKQTLELLSKKGLSEATSKLVLEDVTKKGITGISEETLGVAKGELNAGNKMAEMFATGTSKTIGFLGEAKFFTGYNIVANTLQSGAHARADGGLGNGFDAIKNTLQQSLRPDAMADNFLHNIGFIAALKIGSKGLSPLLQRIIGNDLSGGYSTKLKDAFAIEDQIKTHLSELKAQGIEMQSGSDGMTLIDKNKQELSWDSPQLSKLSGDLKRATQINVDILSVQKQIAMRVEQASKDQASPEAKLLNLSKKSPEIFSQKDPISFLDKKIKQLNKSKDKNARQVAAEMSKLKEEIIRNEEAIDVKEFAAVDGELEVESKALEVDMKEVEKIGEEIENIDKENIPIEAKEKKKLAIISAAAKPLQQFLAHYVQIDHTIHSLHTMKKSWQNVISKETNSSQKLGNGTVAFGEVISFVNHNRHVYDAIAGILSGHPIMAASLGLRDSLTFILDGVSNYAKEFGNQIKYYGNQKETWKQFNNTWNGVKESLLSEELSLEDRHIKLEQLKINMLNVLKIKLSVTTEGYATKQKIIEDYLAEVEKNPSEESLGRLESEIKEMDPKQKVVSLIYTSIQKTIYNASPGVVDHTNLSHHDGVVSALH